MTKKELIERLRALAGGLAGGDEDYEHADAHFEADVLLVEYINDPEVAAVYDVIEKWYA